MWNIISGTQVSNSFGNFLTFPYFCQPLGFKADEIRQAFLRFFTSLFQTYRTYIADSSADGDKFKSEEFLTGLNLSENSKDCVREILSTQMFHNFVEERRGTPNDPEVMFFDDTINAKLNRSRKVVLTGRKKETAFLDDTRSMVCNLCGILMCTICLYLVFLTMCKILHNSRSLRRIHLHHQATLAYRTMVAAISIVHFLN